MRANLDGMDIPLSMAQSLLSSGAAIPYIRGRLGVNVVTGSTNYGGGLVLYSTNQLVRTGSNYAAPPEDEQTSGTLRINSYGIQDVYESFTLSWNFRPPPQQRGVKAELSAEDKADYEAKRKKLIEILTNDKQCRDFLSEIDGLNIEDLIKAVTLQQPYDQRNSTISRIDAGSIAPNIDLSIPAQMSLANAPMNRMFQNGNDSDAIAAIYTGENRSVPANVADRSEKKHEIRT